MNPRTTSPGFREWVFVTLTLFLIIFLLFQLYQYGTERLKFPVGLQVAGVDVGSLTREEAIERLAARYSAPIILYHGDQAVEIDPAQAEFTLDMDGMMLDADLQRQNQDFWGGFWGYLWGRPVNVSPIEVRARHNEKALRETLNIVAQQFDLPPLPPQSVRDSMSFQIGVEGTATQIEASLQDVQEAMYRPTARSATLIVEALPPQPPTFNLLNSLLLNTIQEFEAQSGGVGAYFVLDLQTGEQLSYNGALPMSGLSTLYLPAMIEAVRLWGPELSAEQTALLQKAALEVTPDAANELLKVVAGQDDVSLGANLLTEAMRRWGMSSSFVACPFGFPERLCQALRTEANSTPHPNAAPSPYWQTTADEMGILLSDLYFCAQGRGGTLHALYQEALSAEKCQLLLEMMKQNRIRSLIEQGVPSDVPLAHRHGWQNDTYADVGIIFSEGGAYVLVEFLHKPNALSWELSSPVMAKLSRGVYNYFNFANPYLDG